MKMVSDHFKCNLKELYRDPIWYIAFLSARKFVRTAGKPNFVVLKCANKWFNTTTSC